ncbi:MAG: hypothetical protein WC592_07190 [Candidatus Omnitrophota bacterium]|nr:hypothetical protein [Candidatus Omnitrophota bacterium]
MRYIRFLVLFIMCVSLISLAGCGVSKDKYEALLNEKVGLEEKVSVLTASKEALKREFDDLLKEKMDLSTRLEIMNNEKAALKGEYDKILDEKVTLKASYDKLLADNKELQDRIATR